MVDESGGYVVNTPVYTSADNVQSRHVNAVIDEKGNLTADIYTNTKGIKQELAHYLMHEMDKDEREKYLNKMLNLPTYAVEKFEYKETRNILPEMSEYLHISSSDYATLSGKRLFISPNLFNKSYYKFSDTVDRKYDIVTHESFKEIDSIQITIPSGYVPEAMPKNVSFAGKFGKYSMDCKMENNKIVFYRYNEQSAGRYPKTDFNGLAKFYNDIYKADRAKIVFIKKEG